MANESPAAILFDEQGNPIGVTFDGYTYRLQVESIVNKVIETVSIGNSSTTPLVASGIFQGVGEDISQFVSIDVAVLADVDSAIDGMLFEWSQDNINWNYSDGATYTIQGGVGQNYSLAPRAKYFRCSYTNGVTNQSNFAMSVSYYPVDRSSYRQNLATDVLAQRTTDVVRSVLAAQKQGGAAQTNNYTNLQATTGGFLKVSVDTVVTPAVVIPAIVQTHSSGPNTGTSFTDSFVSDTVINNAIIVLVMQGQDSSGATYNFSDSQGNLYIKGTSFASPGVGQIDLWYTNAPGGPITIGADNFSMPSTVSLQIYEVSGLLIGATILDKAIVSFGNSTDLAVGPILTDHDTEFCISAFITSSGSTITPGPGWTSDFSSPGFYSQSQTQMVAGSITGIATSSIVEQYIGVLVTFLPALISRPIVQDAAGRIVVSSNKPSTTTNTSVMSSTDNTVLLESNTSRLGATIYNDSSSFLYLKLSANASVTDFNVKLFPLGYYEVPYGYTGEIDAVWSNTGGFARIGELT